MSSNASSKISPRRVGVHSSTITFLRVIDSTLTTLLMKATSNPPISCINACEKKSNVKLFPKMIALSAQPGGEKCEVKLNR
jgi:hypothetical protein